MQGGVWHSQVNAFISVLFVGSFALGAGLILWHAAFGVNPVETLFASQMSAEAQSY